MPSLATDHGPLLSDAFLRRLERLSLRSPRALHGGVAGEHASRRRTPAADFAEHRPYTPGDDPRYIDWYAYARHEHVFVKLGELPQDVPVHLLVDYSRSMAWGQPAKLTAALQLAAAIGYVALAEGDRLSVTPFAETLAGGFGPARGKARATELLRFLSSIQPGQGTALAAPLQTYVKQHPAGGLLVLISDLLAGDGIDDVLKHLLLPRWQSIVLHVLDPLEHQPRLNGPSQLQDAETGQRLTVQVDEQTVLRYQQEVSHWLQTLETACSRHAVTYARVYTDWPMERAIIPYLQRRMVIASR